MRTPQEIVEKMEAARKTVFGFATEVLLPYLPFEHAKPFLKEGTTKRQWAECQVPYTREKVLQEAKQYMKEYGWPKCQDHRGISAARTLEKMEAWAWLAGDDEVADTIHRMTDSNYAQYGAPVLKYICKHYGWPIPKDKATQRMMKGQPCGAESCGCGE